MYSVSFWEDRKGWEVRERRKKRTRKPRRAMTERVPPRQMGIIAMSKGPYLEPISVVIICSDRSHVSIAEDKKGALGRDL
jgi:hypothetical protein